MEATGNNAIVIQELTKQRNEFILDHLNLVLPSGCILGLVGENGAGKSTTIQLILNMIQCDEGKITVLGKDSRERPERLREDIGVVLDEVGFPQFLTARQTAKVMEGIFSNWDNARFDELLRQFSLPMDKPFKDYSRGMKMKLGLAAALSHHAKLLVLDEATSGLDPVVRDDILDILLDFTRDPDHSVLLSSHIVSDLEKVCDYIAFLHKGKLLLCEEKDRLMEEYGILHVSPEELSSLPQDLILRVRKGNYSSEVLVRRDTLPASYAASLQPIDLENLFIIMIKGSDIG